MIWLLALLLGADATSWQGWADHTAARMAARILPLPEEERIRQYLWLITCRQDLLLGTPTPVFAAESLRGRRLSEEERLGTVWKSLDPVEFKTNVNENSVVWPDSPERWTGETPLIKGIEKRCSGREGLSLTQELRFVEGACNSPAATAVLRYHRALLRYRLERDPQYEQETLPASLTPSAALLLAEQAYAAGKDLALWANRYAALESEFPAQAPFLRLRQLQIAVRIKDAAEIDRLLASEVTSPVDDYFLAVAVLRLEQKKAWTEIQTLVDQHIEQVANRKTTNIEIVREVATAALVMQPFQRSTIAALDGIVGKSRASRELFRLGSLAVAKNQLGFARDAFTWIVTSSKAMAERTKSKLATVSFLTGDAVELGNVFLTVGETDEKILEVHAALLAVAQTGTAGNTATYARISAALAKFRARYPKNARAMALAREWETLLKKAPGVLEVRLPEGSKPLEPEPPEVRFPLAEPYALIPQPF